MADKLFAQAAEATQQGNLRQLRQMLERTPELLSARDDSTRTLLDLACRAATGNIAIPLDPGTPEQHTAVDLLLEAGADPNGADGEGWSPLHTAAKAGHLDLARRLKKVGASVQATAYGKAGATPLSWALFYAKAYMAEVLTPIHPDNLRAAAALGNDLQCFIDGDQLTADACSGLDFYAPTFFPIWDRTNGRQEVLDEALSWAARNDQCESMASLVALGGSVNSNAFRGTPLLWACYSDRVAAAAWLLDHGADPDLRHNFGGEGHGVDAVALHLAAQHNAVRCVKLLLERGADPSIADAAHQTTPMGWAEYSGATEAFELLQQRPS
jgi:ankyrin repeat protein